VVESGTDVRLVDGLAERFDLTVIAREIPGGVAISRTPERPATLVTGPASRRAFARMAWQELRGARDHFDAVLVQGYALAALAANVVSRFNRLPTSLLVCSPVERYYAQRRQHAEPGKPYRAVEAFGLMALARINARLAHRYVVLSQHLADVVRGHGTTAPVDVIPVYGVDTRIFAPSREPKNVLRTRRGLPLKGSVVFFSSRIAPEKDAETLLAAVKRLLADGRDLWLLHRSGGYQAFLAAARSAGVAERVIATDAVHPVRDLPLDYQISDLLVQASREEGLGFSPLEALACETPVVATAVGGLRETIRDGETGWSYPAGDASALAAQMAAAIDQPAEARRRARAGRVMVQAHYERRLVFDRLAAALVRSRPHRDPSNEAGNRPATGRK
jgi:glycosyltransferase involved in cell wall biosynthesis